jgi:DNA-binding CsgD family transcriptional regulator
MFTCLKRLIPFLILLIGNYCFGQYSISGYLDTPEKNKRVYLSLLEFNELTGISENQILTSTLTDSLGYFSFEGSLLSDKHALYRIYANVDEDAEGVQKYDMPGLKNFHNFIFSNKDTIVFKRNTQFWFSTNSNTNPVDKEWNAYGSYIDKLRDEFSDFSNQEMIKQTTEQFLSELKSFAIEKETHPLTTLVLLGELPPDTIKEDLTYDPDFYTNLQNNLEDYYDNSFYALQYRAYLTDLYKAETEKELALFKKTTYGFALLSLLALGVIAFLIVKLKRAKNTAPVDFSLTTQEEKVAELMMANKSNKEIASELFISLNTVKTHVHSLYAKLEVSNRTEFVEKFKNHPRG